MVGVFVRLKLRLLRNRLTGSDLITALGFVLLMVMALGAGVGLALAFGLGARAAGADRGLVAVLVYCLVAFLWLVGPLVAASIDDSLDPRRFELLPIGRARLAFGLLAAGLAGPGGLATVLGLVGGSLIGFAGVGSAVPVLVTSLVGVLLMVMTARWLTALLSDLLRSRRTQEVAALVFVAVMVVPVMLGTAIDPGNAEGVVAAVRRLLAAAAWTPPGALGRAVGAFAEGDWLLGLAGLAYGTAALVTVVWLAGVALDRLQVRAPTASVTRVRGEEATALYPRRIVLPRSPIGATAAKELKYLRRDVRVRAQLMGSGVALLAIGFTGGRAIVGTPYAPFVGAAVAFLLVMSVVPNQFGFDGGSFWAYVIAGGKLTDVLRGKNLGWGLVAAVGTVVTAVMAAALSREYRYLPAAIASGGAVILLWMAVGNLISVLGAYRLPESNMFGNRNVSGTAMVYSLVGLMAAGVLSVPIALLIAVPAWLLGPLWATVGAIGGAGYAVALYAVSLRLTGSLLEQRSMKLVEVLDG